MSQRKPKTTKRKSTRAGSQRKKRSCGLASLRRSLPRWTRWVGALLVVALYVWLFYYFFVSPYGFRWKALYGDVNYPSGYDIHGIDVSHHQGRIDWDNTREYIKAEEQKWLRKSKKFTLYGDDPYRIK